ncbi:MAG: hypothetical protein ACLQGP_21610 [Isosphaeraceae bacterium]
MQTIDRLSPTATLDRLRAGIDRLWRAMKTRPPLVRVSLVLVPVLGVLIAGYWAALTLVPSGSRYVVLAQGRSFSSEDVTKISQALDAKNIAYRVEDRKVAVAADQYDLAREVFGKLRVGPTTLDEIRRPPDWLSSLVETPQDRERNERINRQKLIEHGIDELDGVVSSEVAIQYPRPAASRHLRVKPSALVTIETETDRRLPSRTLDVIPTIVMSNEPELTRGSITIIDRDGHIYLDPSNPKVGDFSRNRSREEEVRKEILDKLSHIKGVKVWVRLLDRPDDPAPTTPSAASAKSEPTHDEPAPAVFVNQPIALDEPPRSSAAMTTPIHPARTDRPERGRVLITVPRSYYYNRMFPGPEEREPTQEELRGLAARTREQVVKLVGMAVPDSWIVDVETFADDVPLGRPAILPAASDARRKVTDWGIVAVVAATAALVTALASWFQAVRRPVRTPEPEVHSRRYRVDSGDEPNPSDRVRELVRRDPEAAASVLQRWTTQGGRVS